MLIRSATPSGYALLGTIFYLFFSFPFVLRNVNPSLYAAGLAFCVGILIISVLAKSGKPVDTRGIKSIIRTEAWLGCCLAAYTIYFLFLVIVTSSHGDSIGLKSLFYKLQILVFAAFILFFADFKILEKFRSLYVRLLTVFSILGIVLSILLYFKSISPVASIVLDSGSLRDLYWLGLVWPNIWNGDAYGIVRLQSFTDEPGTFAFCLLVGIVFAYGAKQYFKLFVFILALVLTFSIGAWVLFLFMVIVTLIVKRKISHAAIIVAMGLILIGSTVESDLAKIGDFFSTYASAKYDADGDGTSVGSRVNDLSTILKTLKTQPFGVGAGPAEKLGIPIAIGWLVPLAEVGFLGWLFYISSFFLLLVRALKSLRTYPGSDVQQYALIVLIFAYSGLQRGGLDGNFWHIMWPVLFIRVYAARKTDLKRIRHEKHSSFINRYGHFQ